MEISFCSHPNSNEVIAMKFCTWQDSCAIVACATFCCDMITNNWLTAEWNFHQILIVMGKSLVKWAPGHQPPAGACRQGCQRSGKSQGKLLFFKVREKSGNSVKSQGKSLDMGKSMKSQGIVWWMPVMLFFVSQSYTFMLLILVLRTNPGGKILASFCDIFPTKEFPGKKMYVLDTVYWPIEFETFVSQINFHLHYREAKNMTLKFY